MQGGNSDSGSEGAELDRDVVDRLHFGGGGSMEGPTSGSPRRERTRKEVRFARDRRKSCLDVCTLPVLASFMCVTPLTGR